MLPEADLGETFRGKSDQNHENSFSLENIPKSAKTRHNLTALEEGHGRITLPLDPPPITAVSQPNSTQTPCAKLARWACSAVVFSFHQLCIHLQSMISV